MILKTTFITTSCLAVAICSTQAASVTIGGGSFVSMRDSIGPTGSSLTDGSIVQVGYFLGVASTKSGSDFTTADWDSFTAFIGVDSLNPDQEVRTFTAGPGFEAVFQLNSTFDTMVDPGLPANYPVRLGFRIFDAQGNTTAGANFNTVVRDVSTWEFADPEIVTNQPPSPTINDSGDIMFWQDNANPFRTTITPIPEPGTSLSALLGLALLAGARRRK